MYSGEEFVHRRQSHNHDSSRQRCKNNYVQQVGVNTTLESRPRDWVCERREIRVT